MKLELLQHSSKIQQNPTRKIPKFFRSGGIQWGKKKDAVFCWKILKNAGICWKFTKNFLVEKMAFAGICWKTSGKCQICPLESAGKCWIFADFFN